MEIPLDYETLRVIWWGLMGTLLIGFALTDGFDLGVAALLPFVGKTDEERRMVDQRDRRRTGKATRCGSSSAAARSSPPGRLSMRSASRASTWPCSWCCGADPAARRFKYRSKRPTPAWRSTLGLGAVRGRASCRRWCSAWPSATSCRAPPSGSIATCAASTKAPLGLFSPFALSDRAAVGCHAGDARRGWLSVKIERGAVLDRARRLGSVAAVASLVLFAPAACGSPMG
jgi:cytochrome d ubiquinol oxidase subunit II